MSELNGQIAVVIGAAGAIGRALTIALARAGAEVWGIGRSGQKLRETSEEVARADGHAHAIEVDVRDLTALRTAIDAVAERSGRLDILLNAAGAQARRPALEITEEDWNNVIEVNLKAVFFACQAAAKVMLLGGRGGKIINISSLTAVIGLPRLSVYGASKGGVAQLTKSLATEWAPHNIRVNAIAPGRIQTRMTEDLFLDPAARESFLRLIPMARLGLPEDLAGSDLFLASDASRYITGQTIYVDGGWLAAGGNPPG